MKMDAAQIETLFTRSDGSFAFARWGRPVCPIVFGVDDKTLPVIKGAIEAVATLAKHHMAETDPELGTNLMMFFFLDWDELRDVPDLDKLVPELGPLVDRLQRADASQYRFFRFDKAGAIKAAFVFLRMDEALSESERAAVECVLDDFRRQGIDFHAVRTRRAGSRCFVSMHVLVPGDWTVLRGHRLIERVEAAVAAALPGASVFTHLEALEDPASFEDIELR